MNEVRCGKQPAVEALGRRCPEELKTQLAPVVLCPHLARAPRH